MIQVAVIEDERDLQEGLRSLIAGKLGFSFSGVYRPMGEALSGMPPDLLQVALMDIELRGMSDIQKSRLWKESYSEVQVRFRHFRE